MRIKMLIFIGICFCLGFVGCDKVDSNTDSGNEPVDNEATEGKYYATNDIKTITLKHSSGDDPYWHSSDATVFYLDYYYRYSIFLYKGLSFYAQRRKDTYWDFWGSLITVMDCGHISKLTDITSHDIVSNGKSASSSHQTVYTWQWIDFKPQHGYAIKFPTKNDAEVEETKYLRIYAKDYTLDSYGQTSSITIEYSLF